MLCSVVQKGLFDNAYSILHYILLKKQQMEKLYTIFCLTILIVKIPAQTLSRLNIEFQNTSGIAYKMPLAGGLNCPQFSSVDMNNDGKQDIFVFDRIGNVRMTFLNNGNGFDYTPQYIAQFPELNDWALLRDYNGDGIADIFTFNNGAVSGVRIFKGKIVNNQIAFDRVNFTSNGNILNYPLSNGTRTNLYVNNVDIPDIDDIDGDGDLDILSFEVGGGHVYFYKNMSVERGFKKDTLIYELADDCWGRFLDNGFQASVKLGTKDVCANSLKGDISLVIRHPGASLTTYDKDNDGDKDLLIGSVSFENISDLTNGGTAQQAWMTQQDNRFPFNTEGVNLPSFPATYILDVDNDGKKDVVVTPSSSNFIENYNVAWMYKNIGTNLIPSFQLQQKDLFVKDMIDFGAGANPAFVDVDADGLTDLIVGNLSYFLPFNGRDSRLFYYRNIGTNQTPKYKLIDDNWLNFKALSNIDILNFSPTFGDMDGDGDLDMLVGEDSGTLIYIENKGGVGRPLSMDTPQSNWKNIQAGSTSKPQIVDLNRDGLPDIVTGTRNGNLRYFQNIGTASQPNFNTTATNQNLGKIDVRDIGFATGFAAPCFVDFKGKYTLFVGTEGGKIFVYDSLENNLNGTFRLVNNDYGKIRDGARTTPIVRNINGDDKLEMLIGNYRGGLTGYKTTYNSDGTTPIQSVDNQLVIQIYPNPANDFLNIEIKNSLDFKFMKITVFNAMGQVMKNLENAHPQYLMPIFELNAGIYFIEIKGDNERSVLKFVKND